MENNELYCFGDLPVSVLMHSSAGQDDGNIVEHSGIKGMKWGIRRYQNKDGSLTPAGKKRYNKELAEVRAAERIIKNKQATKSKLEKLEERKKALEDREKELETGPKKKTIADMSNEEIQAAIDRIKLENSLKELMKEPVNNSSKKSSKGKELASEIMSNTARNIGTQTVTLLAGTAVNKVLASVFNDDPEMTVNPKKGQKDK